MKNFFYLLLWINLIWCATWHGLNLESAIKYLNHVIQQKEIEIAEFQKTLSSNRVEINRLTSESFAKGAIISELNSKIGEMNMEISQLRRGLSSKDGDINRLNNDVNSKNFIISEFTLQVDKNKMDFEQLKKELLSNFEYINHLKTDLKNKDLKIEQVKNEITITESNKNEEIVQINKRLFESEKSREEMSEIIRIKDNLRTQLNTEILQLNHDLQAKQSEIDELKRSIISRSRQRKLKPSFFNNSTDFWA
jgi:chromosome segregation ATPase